MSGIPYQSKLLPFKEIIREARRKHISYRKIAEILKENYGIKCTYNSVFSFVKARSKKRKKVITMLEEE